MLKMIEDAGVKYCFPRDGMMYCTWVNRKTKSGTMAMVPNESRFLKFPITWKPKKKDAPPNLEDLGKVINIIHLKNEKTPSLQA